MLIWPPNDVAFEQYGLRIPADFAPGRCAVAMDVHRLPFFQNRSLSALLGDRDEYSRIPIGTIEVVARTEIGS